MNRNIYDIGDKSGSESDQGSEVSIPSSPFERLTPPLKKKSMQDNTPTDIALTELYMAALDDEFEDAKELDKDQEVTEGTIESESENESDESEEEPPPQPSRKRPRLPVSVPSKCFRSDTSSAAGDVDTTNFSNNGQLATEETNDGFEM